MPDHVELLGQLPHDEVLKWMKGARFLIFPSEWYEGFPITLIEAMACGTPIVASDLGSIAEIIQDGHTGLLFKPGEVSDLVEKARYAQSHDKVVEEMGVNARRIYEARYSTSENYSQLMRIYQSVIERHSTNSQTSA